MYSDLHTDGKTVTGLEELGSFSSGHVAEPLVRESTKNVRPREKQSDALGSEFLLTFLFSKILLLGSVPGFVLKPDQGKATDALLEKKLSDDRTFFGLFVLRPCSV